MNIVTRIRTALDWLRRRRGERKPPSQPDEPPMDASGVRSPLIPVTPLLSGAAARNWPPDPE